ncbi:MAG TPA: hypothetical protein VK897_03780 [Anaerolineales bacterium]|nr:hypothetical protein [Anaerolineales bacterium]
MRHSFILLIALSLILSACGTLEISLATPPPEISAPPAGSAFETIAEPELSLTSSSEEIQHAMLESATNWLTIWMDGTVTQYALDGSDTALQVTREQVWIDQSLSRFRILTGSAEGMAEKFKASDGTTILEMDLKSGQSQSYPLPDFAKVKQFVPTLEPGYGYPQPLWGQMGTELSQLAFSSDLAQNEGTFKAVATEFVADREAVVVEWTYAQNDLPSWRLWLDAETAVILKMQTFAKEGGESIQSEAVVNQVTYDDIFADSLFRAPVSLPQFGDVKGGESEPAETGAEASSGRDALGELYFFTLPHQSGQAVQMVRLPGLCVVGLATCPKLEPVTPPFPFDFTLTPLSWSPDGNLAAFSYPDGSSGTPHKLWLFDPAADTWTSLFEYAYIDPPFWSPDGDWIAFRVQDGLGGEDVYAIRRDGSGLRNLTASSSLPDEGRPYVMDGWITGNIIAHSAKPGNEGTVYLIRVADGHVQPMFDRLVTKAVFIPSSDGAWLAYDDYNYDSQKHTLFVTEPDGANPVEVASFTGGSLYPIIWSPDNTRLAFVYYMDYVQNSNPTADVYVINRNGTGLKQVYRGVTVGSIMFSPDGNYLLVDETTSPTGGHLFAVNLDTLDQRIIQAPGLSLDTDWYLPSWRK